MLEILKVVLTQLIVDTNGKRVLIIQVSVLTLSHKFMFIYITKYNDYVRVFGFWMNIGTGEYAFLMPGHGEVFFLSCLDEHRKCGVFICLICMNTESVN